MKIEAFVLVQSGCEPCVAQKPWETLSGKWYRLTAEVLDPFPIEEVPAVVTEFP